jgi:hypothetical protein
LPDWAQQTGGDSAHEPHADLDGLHERDDHLRKRKEESDAFDDVAAQYGSSRNARRLLTNGMKLRTMPGLSAGNAVAVAQQSSRLGSRAGN